MNVLFITIPVSLLLVAFFVTAFIMAVRRDQFEDLVTPAHRMLLDDHEPFAANGGPLADAAKPLGDGQIERKDGTDGSE